MQKFNLRKDVPEDMLMSITLWIWCTISMEASASSTHSNQHRPFNSSDLVRLKYGSDLIRIQRYYHYK